MLDDARMLLRFLGGLRQFVRTPLSSAECRRLTEESLLHREQSFLTVLRRAVYEHAPSPYGALLRWAGVALGDVERLVRADGIEHGMRRLLEAGVYLTLDEFKGRKPVCRPGLEIPMSGASCDSPLLTVHFQARTGGSGGAPRRLAIDLRTVAHDAQAHSLFLDGTGLRDAPMAVWRPAPPGAAGLKKVLHQVKLGLRVDRWFSQNELRFRSAPAKSLVFGAAAVYGGRLAGAPMPAPIHVPLGRATVVARWMSEALARSGRAHLDTNVSSAVRVCRAAAAEGLPLAGGFFRLGGEPFTPARQRIFIEAGCRALSHYSISEAGHMAIGCGDPGTHDDMHLLTDKMAVVQAGAAPGLPERPGIEPFFLTTLLPSSPKLMLNVESGDYGVMEGRACGCPLGEAGFRTHIRGVRSYEKLTGEGMHFVGSHLLDLVENVLPDRFGGDPTDYQFAESEERGLPVVALRIHPRLGAIDEEAAVTAVLAALGSGTPGGVMMAGQWRQGRTLRVERTPPLATFASKILALDSPRPSGHE